MWATTWNENFMAMKLFIKDCSVPRQTERTNKGEIHWKNNSFFLNIVISNVFQNASRKIFVSRTKINMMDVTRPEN